MILKNIGKGAGIRTAIFLLLMGIFIASYSVDYYWWPYDNSEFLVLATLLGGLPAAVYCLYRKNWWAVAGATVGYAAIMIIVGMLIEIGAGPAGF